LSNFGAAFGIFFTNKSFAYFSNRDVVLLYEMPEKYKKFEQAAAANQ
jgi:hypothetical protein